MASIEMINAQMEETRAFTDAGISDELNVDAMRRVLGPSSMPLPNGVVFDAVRRKELVATWIIPRQVVDTGKRIVYVHGGVAGGFPSHNAMVAWLAKECSLPILFVDYPLAPEQIYPVQVLRTLDAINLARAEGPSTKTLANRLFLAADSAGAAIALAAMQQLRDEGSPLPNAAAFLCGMFELETSKSEFLQSSPRREAMVSAYLGPAIKHASDLSPLNDSFVGLPPMLLQTGSEDACKNDSLRCAEKAQKTDIEAILDSVDGAFHVWQRFAPIVPESSSALVRVARFFASQ
jgi:acetyl esterase/lipase